MTSEDPQEPWPPRYPAGADQYPASPYQAPPHAGLPPAPSAAGRTWAIAGICGGAAYIGLLAVHLSTDSTGSAAFRAGEMITLAVGSTVVVALLAGGTGGKRRGWPWWVIALSVLSVSSLWYGFAEVAPRIENDQRAEESGEADYVLATPERAGDWRRLDGANATAREKESLARIENGPDDISSGMDAVYGEYGLDESGRLFFLGLTPTGQFLDELRESSSSALRNFLAGSGIEDQQQVDAGALGGDMACDDDPPGVPDGVVFCGWADASTLGQVTLVLPELDLDRAADLTRDFREAVTSR